MSTSVISENISEDVSQATTLAHLLRWRAEHQSERRAYTFLLDGEIEEACLTYSELDARARAIAAMLQKLDARGKRVLLLYPPGLDYIAAFFGCFYAGAVAVPAYPPRLNRSLGRLQTIIADAQASVVLTTETIHSRIEPLFEETPGIKQLDWATTDDLAPELADEWREPVVKRESLAFLQYTSGSTAAPRGVMVSHANLLHNQRLIQQTFRQTEESIILGWLPLYHDMGLIGNVLQPLYVGAPCILMSPVAFLQKPSRWLQAISRYRATTSGAPNFAYDLCARKTIPEQRAELDLSSWTTAFNGAEPVRRETMERFAQTFEDCGFRRQAFHPCYGLAEATLLVSGGAAETTESRAFKKDALEHNVVIGVDAESVEARSLVACGRALPDQGVVVVNPETLMPARPDEVGEIWVSGASVTQGYWNRPEETEHTFHAYLADTGEGPFLRTGDLGFLDAGELFITGRLKDLIIIRGRNHYPQDIEQTVGHSHPVVEGGMGAAFSVEVEGEERLVVVQELNHRATDSAEVLESIIEAVGREHDVQVYAVVLVRKRSLPKTSSGKIQRRACRNEFLNAGLQAEAEWREDQTTSNSAVDTQPGPSTDVNTESIEAWLTGHLASRLGVSETRIERDRPIVRYGVDSLMAVELTHEIETRFGVILPTVSLLQDTSIAELVAEVQAQLNASASPSIPALARMSERQDVHTLSRGQQGLWFMHQLAPESAAYNISAAVRVRAELDSAALRRAFQSLTMRHASLRTTFEAGEEGTPWQRVHDYAEIFLQEEDASTWTDAALRGRLVEEAHRPFDLEHGPLLRVGLFRRSTHEHILQLTLHHIVTDFWSLGILMRELGALYEAEKSGATLDLAPLHVEYTDYARWQTEMLAGDEGERLWSYWQEKLAGELPVLDIPADAPRPLTQTFRGASESIVFDAKLTAELKAFSQTQGTTLYMTLLAAFQTLLYRYTGQEDLLIGSPTAGRSRAELANLAGYFVNPVVLREDLSGNPTFAEFMERVRRTVLDAFAHQDYPFSLLVERLQPVRTSIYPPLFQAMFVLQKAHQQDDALASFALSEEGARMNLGGLEVESIALEQRIAQVDMTLVMAEMEDGLAASLQYNTDLFEPSTIRQMLGHLESVLRVASTTPDARLATLPLLNAGERQQLLVEWNDTQIEFESETCIHSLFEAQVERTPNAVAVVFDGEQVTYAELNRRANQLAHHLQSLGVGAETLVGISIERSIETVVGLLGILKAGGAYLPLDVSYPPERISFMLGDAHAPLLITQQHRAAALAPYAPRLLCLDSDGAQIALNSDLNLRATVSANNLAYVIYTSGSTGKPKGVLLQHRGLVNLVAAQVRAFDIRPESRLLQFASLSFDASVSEIFTALLTGATLLMAKSDELMQVESLARLLREQQVTVVTLPPVVLGILDEQEVPELATVVSAGEACTMEIATRWAKGRGRRFINAYGPTETTVCATLTIIDSDSDVKPTIGRAIENVEVYVLDEQLELAPIGVTGELYVGGAGVGRGYLGRPELTAERFVPDPFGRHAGGRLYRTGDLVRYLRNGQIEYLGRIDQQVKIRGFRIELGEIQAALLDHPALSACAVIDREDHPGDKRLVAYIVFNQDSSITITDLREYLKERLPDYMMPAHFVTLEDLPLTHNGKLNRRALPPPAASRDSNSRPFIAPRSPLEDLLSSIYSRLLRVERVGVHDNFFELGGHSLLATQLISRIRETFSVELPLRTVFESATVADLCAKIEQEIQQTGSKTLPPLRRVSREEALPLSFAQQRLWFLHQMEPESAVYNMPAAVRLTGQLNTAALEATLTEIVRRHESLRTSFTNAGEEPRQVIHAAEPWILNIVDLSALSESERAAEVERLADEEARRPFDLKVSPLLRTTLVQVGEAEHVLLWTMHHIISDGWSMGVLIREVAALYEAFVRGAGSPLEELPIQYADYAVWQRETLNEEVIERQLAYWRKQLGGELPVLELPTDHVRPAVQTFRGAVEQVVFSKKLSEGLREVSRREGATLYMVLLAAFKVLLSRYTGQEEIIVGSPIAGRNRVETEGLIGFFVNTLVLRTQLRGDEGFSELVKRVREVVLEGYTHQEVPFEKLVEELKPERDLSRSPLFQVMFVLRNTPTAVLELPGIELSALNAESGSAKFDLMLSMAEVTDGLVGWFEYNTDLFEPATIRRMFGHFETLLEAIVADTAQAVSEMPLLTTAEHRQLLVEWNDNRTGYTGAACIHERFETQALRVPAATAVVFGEEEISYGELNRRANQLAHHLQILGVGPETLVGICVERSIDMIVGLLGILKAGGAYVPLDPSYPAQRLALMLEDSEALVLLTQQRLTGALDAHNAKVVNIDTDWNIIARHSADNPVSDVRASNTAYVIYTSGSTGRPKGVVIEHRTTVAMIDWSTSVFTADELSSVLASTSICFDISTFELFVTLSVGGRIVLTENALHLRSLPADVDISLINTVPSAMAELVRMGALPSSIRTVNLAGEPLQNRLAQEIYQNENIRHVYNLYGPTEDTTYSTFALVKKDAQQAPPIGRPLANSQAYIVDERMQPVPIGVAGELFLGGAGVTRGYLRRPELTAERYIPDPFSEEPGARLYRTGDLTRYLPDGTIEYLGRIDHQVKIRGFRIELGEIQTALTEQSPIQDCAVLAREDQPGDKRLVAYIVCKPDTAVTTAELRRALQERLPDYMVPAHFVILDELPLTPNGKLNRRALPVPVASRDSLVQSFTAPRSPLEELLASIFCDLLSVERIGVDDNFFELGGHSLLATQLISRIREAFSVELPLRTIFESATVADLCAKIEQEIQATGGQSLPPLQRVSREEALPLSFAQQRLWFLHQLEPERAVYNMPAAVRLTGQLNITALEATLTEIVRRHESLRTSFTNEGEEPRQVIHPAEPWSLNVIDLSKMAESERAAEVERLADEEAHRPFDLQISPLLRTTLVQTDEQDHVLLWTMHHIISDGWSMGVIIREVAALYEAFVRGAGSPLPDLPIQYADYAVWQRETLNEEVIERQLAYWRQQLGGELPVLELPTDYARPVTQSYRGAVERIELSRELSEELREVSKREGATLYMVLLAAFKVLLSRYTGQEEIIVGSPIAGRNRVETEGLIGFFLNTLALRTDLSGEPTFQQLLARVNEVTIGAYTHQEVPFEKLLEELNPERRLGRSPVFQVLFNMLNFPASKIELPGLKIESQTAPDLGSKFDLTLYVNDDDGIRFTLVYNTDLFKRERMVEMLDQFRHLLSQVSDDPSIEIKRLSLVTPSAARLLPEPTQAMQSQWQGAVHQLFAEHARKSADHLAVTDKHETWTYGQLEERSNQLANYLRACGIQRRDVVAIYAHRSATLVWAIYGILKAGATFLILDPAYPELRLIDYLRIAKPRGWLQLEEAGALPPALKDFVESLSCCAHFTLQPRAVSEAQSFLLNYSSEDTGVAVGTGDTLAKYPVDDPSVEIGPDDIACITFTSGSTGTPKGVLGKHIALTLFANWTQKEFGINEQDRFSMLSGLAHDPLQRDIFTPLQLGASVSIPDPKEIGTHGWLARWMKQESVTVTNLTPAMGQLLTETATESDDYEVPSLRYAFFVGDMLTRRDVARLKKLAPSVTSINLYGATETQRSFGFFADEESAKETLPVGRGIDGVQLLVLNAAQGLAGIGELGEIYFRSPYLARGYQDDDELTGQRFITNPFTGLQDDRLYKSGDVGRYLPDGNVEMLGRMDQQVKIRGFRVELGEIHARIAEHPEVQDCAVLAREDQPGDKRLVAYIVFKPDCSVTNAELRRTLQERLPDYMVPAHFVILDELPLTPNGKLNRRALPAPVASRDSLAQSFTAPRSPLEELLASIFCDLLSVQRVGIDDNFFELGGHSLLATQLISRIRTAFHVELPLRTVFESGTVAALSAKIEQEIQAVGGKSLPPLQRVSRTGALPLSFAQQRLWFLHQLESESAVYNMPAALRLSGDLNIAALEATLTEIVRRHESLRTSFAYADEQPCQVVHAAENWDLSVVDISAMGESERGAEVRRLADEEARRPFDLQVSPLLRTTLVQTDEQEHVLLWTMHHIISDGWSMGLLIREVAALYETFLSGAVSPLAELPIQYADYSVWQRETLNSEVIEPQLTYWRKQLSGELPVIELPTDYMRPAVQTFRGAVERVALSRELTKGLREVSRREGATLYMVLLAAFKVLLSRYTGQEDIIVGSPIAGRNRVETEGLIGFFVNTLVLRTQLKAEESFSEVVKRVREVVLEGHANQEVPFEKLVEELKPKRDLSRSPLFQVAFMFQNAEPRELASSGLSLSMLQSHAGASKFDATLSLVDDGQELSGTLEYNTDLYDASTMERLAANFKTLLEGVVANQTQRVSELPLLTAMEETRVVTEWNQTVKAYDKDSCIHQLFEAQVERTPNAVAVVFENEQVTYAELNRRANQLAHHLQSVGVRPETLVGICVERSIEMVVGLLGILKAGGAYVPLDPSYPTQRLALMLQDSGVKVLLTQQHLLKALPARAATIVCVDKDREAIARKSEENPSCSVTGGNLAYIIFTSGSTGRPKGVQIQHAGFVNFLTSMLEAPGLTSDDVVLTVTSLSFDIAGLEIFLPLMIGAREVVISREVASDGTLLKECLNATGITVMQATPATYRLLLNAGWDNISGIKIMCGGEAFPRELANHLIEKGAIVWNMYGPTESTVWSTVSRVEMRDGPISIGRPITNTQIYLLDPQLRPVPIGVAGELFIGGDGLTRGYIHRPQLTAEKMVPDPFDKKGGARLYRTGDLARFLPDGNIEFLSRIDHQVKVRGHRIELGEIEVALVQHEAVEVGVVMAREDSPGDKRLVAYIVPDTTMPAPTVSELRNFLSNRLPEYMIPSNLVVLEALPLTPSGKVDRRALPTPDGDRPTLETPFVAPRNDLERSIVSVWQEVLNLSKVGIHDNFFDLGGHSMSLVQIHGKLRARLKRDLSVVEMFRYPTVNALAKHLGQPAKPATSTQADDLNDKLAAGKKRMQKIFRQERRGNGDGQSTVSP